MFLFAFFCEGDVYCFWRLFIMIFAFFFALFDYA